jgi:hypothetical protein
VRRGIPRDKLRQSAGVRDDAARKCEVRFRIGFHEAGVCFQDGRKAKGANPVRPMGKGLGIEAQEVDGVAGEEKVLLTKSSGPRGRAKSPGCGWLMLHEPMLPSVAEMEEHALIHVPFRIWC